MNQESPSFRVGRMSIKEIDELSGSKNFFFAGRIVVKGLISVTGFLMAGSGIEAGEGIKAGLGIKAGSGIKAGEGYGVFAGLRVKIGKWDLYAKVTAKTKPENLISGFWVELSKAEEAA